MGMTPQDLMDLPHAGMAEKQLRRDGRWRLTPHEEVAIKLERALDAILGAKEAIEEANT